jgi:hypothetical protein
MDEGMHVVDSRDRCRSEFCWAKGRRGEEVSRALQSTPGIVAEVAVLGDPGHCEWVERLHQECTESTDEHGCIRVHDTNRSIHPEPALTGSLHDLRSLFIGTGSDDAFAQRITE